MKILDYSKIQNLVFEGKNLNQIAAALKISRETLRLCRKKDPRLDNILGEIHSTTAKPIDYTFVKALARVNCTEYEIAEATGFTQGGFSRRRNWDEKLVAAINSGHIEVKISVRRAQYRKGMDRYLTICKDCEKIFEGEFKASCPYCDAKEPDPTLRGARGAHTNVKHKYVPGDTTMLIWLGKQILHQSDKAEITHSGNPLSPLAIENLTEKELDVEIERLLRIAQRSIHIRPDRRTENQSIG
jgi:hypothetical protein